MIVYGIDHEFHILIVKEEHSKIYVLRSVNSRNTTNDLFMKSALVVRKMYKVSNDKRLYAVSFYVLREMRTGIFGKMLENSFTGFQRFWHLFHRIKNIAVEDFCLLKPCVFS